MLQQTKYLVVYNDIIEHFKNNLICWFNSHSSRSWNHASANERNEACEKQPHYTFNYSCGLTSPNKRWFASFASYNT